MINFTYFDFKVKNDIRYNLHFTSVKDEVNLNIEMWLHGRRDHFSTLKMHPIYNSLYNLSWFKEEKQKIWLGPMTKAPTPTEK